MLPRQRPFLTSLSTLARDLRPGVTDLRATLPVLNDAIEVGTPVLARSPATNQRLEAVLRSLNQVVSQPTTRLALQRLQETFDTAEPLAEYVAPAQTVCNYFNYWFTFLPGALSRPRPGRLLVPPGALADSRVGVDAPADGYSAAQTNGLQAKAGRRLQAVRGADRQRPPLRARRASSNADCEGGQSGYELGQGLLPGQSPSNPAYGVTDLPGSRGPTTLFYNDANERELADTRNPSRAPETWEGIGQ